MPASRADYLVFLGTPAVAAQALQVLLDSHVAVGLVVTGVAKRRGRGADLSVTPVQRVADAAAIPVVHDFQSMQSFIASRGGSWMGVVVAYGSLVPTSVLSQLPMVNLHFSLLPRWRGAAPVERAILEGDQETGVCVMQVVEGLDEGPIFARRSMPLDAEVTAEEVRRELCRLGMTELVRLIAHSEWSGVPQTGEVVYAHKITKSERRIDWELPSSVVLRVIRIGGAFTNLHGRRLKVQDARLDEGVSGPGEAGLMSLVGGELVVRCGEGSLVVRRVQPEGKAEMDGVAWWNGVGRTAGEARFG